MIGTAVGSYRITAKIAEGGMGAVYRADHMAIGKVAAIKVLHAGLSHDRSIVDRFFNEAKATTAIRHPGIVEVWDFGYLESGAAFLVMEFLDGEPLSRYLKRRGGRIPEGEAAWLILGMCSALGAAHAKSIVHRDLKPDNVFMVPDPTVAMGVRPKLLDFGIAKLSGSEIASSKTRTGSVMGTPTYMSPEQCKGTGDVDHRADLYSLGCMLYEMLCGRPPFVSEGAGELIGAHLFVAPDSPRVYAPQVSQPMEQMVLRLLAKQRDQRPASATELADQLGHLARVSGGGWVQATPVPGYPPRVQTPVRGIPATGAPELQPVPGPTQPMPAAQESTQPMAPIVSRMSGPIGGAPGGMRPSHERMVDAATVMESLQVPASGPMRASAPRPQESWPPMPMPTPPPPHMMTPPPPHMMTPPPMPTPPPRTTLSGATGVRHGQGHEPRSRTRWPVAIAVIVLFAAASAVTTYMIIVRGDRRTATAADPDPTPPTPTTTTTTPTTPSNPSAAPPVTPTPALAVTPDAAPATVASDAVPAATPPDAAPDPEPKPEPRKRKRDKPKSPGPIEIDI